MKFTLIAILAFSLIIEVQAQGPSLSLVGSSPSLTKGTINTELLSEIIQQKQEEIKQRVFRNIIVKQFNNASYTDRLKNFTTYHYLYNVMDVVTSGKNKTAMTKSVMENSTEFAYVFGLAFFVQNYADALGGAKTFGEFSVYNRVIEDAKVSYVKNTIHISNDVKNFNILIDLCYKIILEDAALQKAFNFKDNLNDNEFKQWYNSDNVFLTEYENPDNKSDLDNLEKDVKIKLQNLSTLISNSTKMLNSLEELKLSGNANLKGEIESYLKSYANLSGAELKSKIQNLVTTYSSVMSETQKDNLNGFATAIGNNYDNIKQLISFYSGLNKSNFKDFSLTKEQYDAMKYILVQFLDLAKNQYPNNTISTVIDFLLENTIVEFVDNSTGNIVAAANSKASDKGYLFIDVEAIISSVNQKFTQNSKKMSGVYFQPYFGVGTNYATFPNTNTLVSSSGISNLYFASEKIGFKWKLWNWKYTHSFAAGESFKYFNQFNFINPWHWGKKWNPNRYWLRPQPKPTISDVHILAYTSGLLYNVTSLKSNENFNYAIVGSGVGLTFFNGLTASVSVAIPYTEKKINQDNLFLNFGFDIPIVEYVAALAKKN